MKTRHKLFFGAAAVVAAVAIAAVCWPGQARKLYGRLFMHRENVGQQRGDIIDCKGNVMATGTNVYDIRLDCMAVQDDMLWEELSSALAEGLAGILPECSETMWTGYLNEARNHGERYLGIASGVSAGMRDSLSALPLFNLGRFDGGFICEKRYVRIYPYGNLARRTIGYPGGGTRPPVGIDGAMDVLASKAGSPVRTTIDMECQSIADSCLREVIGDNEDIVGACMAVMEVGSGAIRTAVNLSRLSGARNLTESFNYLIGHRYEPGEVAQTMTLAASLSDGHVKSLDEMLPTEGGVVRAGGSTLLVDLYIKTYGSDSISVLDGFAMSSRYVSAKLAGLYSSCPQKFIDEIRSYCLPDSLQFDIDGCRKACLVEPGDSLWEDAALPEMGYGYRYVVTPLHLLSFYNMVAGRGKMMKPYLVESVGNYVFRPEMIAEETLKQEVADTLKRALLAVTDSGTGKCLKNAKYRVAGKTGTATQLFTGDADRNVYQDEYGKKMYGSTFAGFFPAEAPRYSIICVIFTKPCHRTYGAGIPAMAVRKFVDSI